MGNLYVLINNFKYIFDPSGGKMRMDVLYYALVYILMAFTLVCSDTMFVLGVLEHSSPQSNIFTSLPVIYLEWLPR